MPYRRAAYTRFSAGESFLKKAASALTRLISRLTAISSRSTSRPKISMRPASSVSSVLMSRIRVDLPPPLAPRMPRMPPRSTRSVTSSTATTGRLWRPTTKVLVTWSMRSAGRPEATAGDASSGPHSARRAASGVTAGASSVRRGSRMMLTGRAPWWVRSSRTRWTGPREGGTFGFRWHPAGSGATKKPGGRSGPSGSSVLAAWPPVARS